MFKVGDTVKLVPVSGNNSTGTVISKLLSISPYDVYKTSFKVTSSYSNFNKEELIGINNSELVKRYFYASRFVLVNNKNKENVPEEMLV